MSGLISGIVSELKSIHQDRKQEVSIGATPDLSGDPVLVFQIFSNLISNAVKYNQGTTR